MCTNFTADLDRESHTSSIVNGAVQICILSSDWCAEGGRADDASHDDCVEDETDSNAMTAYFATLISSLTPAPSSFIIILVAWMSAHA